MAKYWKASLLCTACFWGVLALAVPLRGNLSFGFFVVCWLSYYASGGVLAFRAASAFQREWLRLFPDQGTRYDDVRWGKGNGGFLPGPFRIRAGLRQMENEMLASPDKTEETEQIVYASRNAPFVLLVDFVVFSATTCFCFFTCAFL